MDIAAMSTGLSLASIQMQAGLSMTKGAMESAESQATQLLEGRIAANPPSAHKIDMLV